VTYTAVIDVDNSDGRLAPGTTAIVTVNSGSRQNVTRLPNNALSFRPSPAVLEKTGQDGLEVESKSGGPDRMMYVWKYQNNRFVPVEVRTGLSDDRWTEMLSGDVQPGDQLVTSASAER
jgi:HlyD family secretion protein